MICKRCKMDHTKRNEGPLTVCEAEEYRKTGSWGSYGGKRVDGFGIGQNRFQLRTAK